MKAHHSSKNLSESPLSLTKSSPTDTAHPSLELALGVALASAVFSAGLFKCWVIVKIAWSSGQ